jgi:hypothetical protein
MKWFLNKFIIFCITLMSLAAWADPALTTYNIKWDLGKLPLSVSLYEGGVQLLSRGAEMGEFKDRYQLPILKEITDGKIQLTPGDDKPLVLVLKNNTDKAIRFSVAPHSIVPIEASLGFSFKCLCNGHKYTIKPKSSWYRVLDLKTFKQVSPAKSEITLEHQIFPVK